MTTYNWTITQMDRLTSDGFVINVNYNVSAVDGGYTVSTYGMVTYDKQPNHTYTPYDDLTESQVVGWVQNSLDKNIVEASLQSQINTLKTPIKQSGVPWST